MPAQPAPAQPAQPAAPPAPPAPPAQPPIPADVLADQLLYVRTKVGGLFRSADLDHTSLSLKKIQGAPALQLGGRDAVVDRRTSTITVGGVQRDLTEGLATMLLASPQVINARSRFILPDDMTAYRSLLARPLGEYPASSKRDALETLGSQLGAGLLKGKKKREQTRKRVYTEGIIRDDGRFGGYKVDPIQLGQGVLHAERDGKVEIHQKISDGLRHLLTRHATAKQAAAGLFRPGDVAHYHQLATQAGIRLNPTDNRNKFMKNPVAFLPDDPKVLQDRVKVLEGMRAAGDQSTALLSELVAIYDRLLQRRDITAAQHKDAVKPLLSSPKKSGAS
jgi:hypothetical protein